VDECGSAGGMRHKEEGWVEIAVPDGRRGLWIRATETSVEICAGREGGDAYTRFDLGSVVTSQCTEAAMDCLECLSYAHEIAKMNADRSTVPYRLRSFCFDMKAWIQRLVDRI